MTLHRTPFVNALGLTTAVALLSLHSAVADAQGHAHAAADPQRDVLHAEATQGHAHDAAAAQGQVREATAPAAAAARVAVALPAPMREHLLANMRDHLAALQEISDALATRRYERAAEVAERRLGLSSLEAHGAAHMAPFMPKGMQEIGTAMHRAASRLAVEAQTAGTGDDLRPAFAAVSGVMQQCVACHAGYRLK